MTYPHGPSADSKELKAIEKRIVAHKRWIQGALSEIGSVLKLRQDYDYYKQLAVRLEKRIEVLEKRLGG